MFAHKKPLPFNAGTDYTTPGYGDGLPGNMQIDGTIAPDPYAGQRLDAPAPLPDQPFTLTAPTGPADLVRDVQIKPRFFESGGLGGKIGMGLLGGALDGVAHYGGLEGGFNAAVQAARTTEQEQAQWLAREKWKRENREAQVLNLGNGGIARVGPSGEPEILREPTTDPLKPTDFQRNYEFYKGLPDTEKPDARSLLPNYGFTPGGISAAERLAEIRAAATARHRAPPRSAAAHLPPNFILD